MCIPPPVLPDALLNRIRSPLQSAS
jgi:hypothetical protein